MSTPMPAAAPAAAAPQGGAVTLFGRRVSYDSLVVAGATLLGIFFVWRLNQSGSVNLGVPAAAAADTTANPSLPTPGSAASTVTSDPTSGSPAGGGVMPTTTLGLPPRPTPQATGSGTGRSRTLPPARPSGGSGVVATVAKIVGKIGTGGGPNTTGRSSGTQIYDGASIAAPVAHRVNSPHTVPTPVPHPAAPIPVFRAPVAGGRGGPQML